MKTGIFGGSFNPAHTGHYKIVRLLLSLNKVDKIIIVPNYTNPLKSDTPPVPLDIKWSILEATFSRLKNVELSDYETSRSAPSYTFHTLEHFKAFYPEDQLYFIIGEDAFRLFPKWYHPDKILKLSKIVVIPRPGQRSPLFDIHSISKQAEWLPVSIPDISSTQIRSLPHDASGMEELLYPDAIPIWRDYQQQIFKSLCKKK